MKYRAAAIGHFLQSTLKKSCFGGAAGAQGTAGWGHPARLPRGRWEPRQSGYRAEVTGLRNHSMAREPDQGLTPALPLTLPPGPIRALGVLLRSAVPTFILQVGKQSHSNSPNTIQVCPIQHNKRAKHSPPSRSGSPRDGFLDKCTKDQVVREQDGSLVPPPAHSLTDRQYLDYKDTLAPAFRAPAPTGLAGKPSTAAVRGSERQGSKREPH